MKITVVSKNQNEKSLAETIPESPEDRLDLVEKLRREAGKFIYDGYPERLRRVITIVRKESR